MQKLIDIPIKHQPLPVTDNIALKESDEKFVDVSVYSKGEIKVSMQYAQNGIPSAVKKAYVRETVAKKLMEAKKLLPDGYTFEILDAWRPYEVQLSLFSDYYNQIAAGSDGNMTQEQIMKKACEFVSFPDKSKQVSYVHSTGGAVDITILDSQENRLDMGTQFDDFSEKSHTSRYEEEGKDEQIRNNRRLLNNVMCACGFTNYPAEWWHYDYGDLFWAFYMQRETVYSSKFEEVEVKNND